MKKQLFIPFLFCFGNMALSQTYLPLTGGTITGTLKIENTIGGTETTGLSLTNKDGSSGTAIGINFQPHETGVTLAKILARREGASNGPTSISFYTYNDGIIPTGLNLRMKIDQSGNVGIGTNTPSTLLDIAGKVQLAGDGTVPPAGLMYGIFAYTGVGLGFYSAAGATTQGIGFWTNGGSVKKEAMRISSYGNVGIGTTSPAEKLSVNGNILAKKLIVTQVGWADDVFDKNYCLKTLQDLGEYIQKNKHLPGIPTAEAVIQKGIDVGDTQALLLRKIEELTLYVIAQQKQLDKQSTEIQILKSKH